MKKLLLIITLGIVVLHADEIYPKWEDAKQFKYNEAVISKNYKEVGLKEKIKEVEGEEISYYTSGRSPENLAQMKKIAPYIYDEYIAKGKKFVQKLRTRTFKINKRKYRWIGYVEDTGIPWKEDVYFYKNNIDKKPYYHIARSYYEDGSIKDEYCYLNDKHHKSKTYYKSGALRAESLQNDFLNTKIYDENASLIKEFWEVDYQNMEFQHLYKNGILVQEIAKRYDKLDGFSIKYNDKGELKWNAYYEDGEELFAWFCPFETLRFTEKLELKHLKYFAYRRRNTTYCQKIEKGKYFMVTSYDADTYEGEKPKYLDVMVSVVDTNKKKILASYYEDNTSFGYEEQFYIDRFSRKSKINKNVIDVINEVFINRWETEKLYNSYKYVMGKIIPLAKENINLQEIEKEAKTGKHFTSDELIGIVNECAKQSYHNQAGQSSSGKDKPISLKPNYTD